MSNTTGQWLGWIGILVGIIAFFWQPVWMGVAAVVLGIIGLFSHRKDSTGQRLLLGQLR
ncbi:hypothetical protein SAMN02745249_00125 [Atopostipes suicloacalis DSM 15692]|uniref:Uncharacterized protein n=1 Tax=Atopostipes suicloacalis DSM 15692 TaxID=1121025 RepID=A0A1M4S9B3_9LACT|nr:C4-dicarboxylate ABC transporter [Atopostipes suicloacalis]SHE28637.1 hypothetical protein SAMN02745249_00125 [Atopostipes suicloacalis DSM 15692]